MYESFVKSILSLSLLYFPSFLVGQPDTLKNKVKIYYEHSISKTNFETSLKNASLSQWQEINRITKPLLGNKIGIEFGRLISNKNWLFLSFRYTKKGQKSPHFFNFPGKNTLEDYHPNYGGLSYELIYFTNELSLLYAKELNIKPRIILEPKIGISLDIYKKLILQDYLIDRETGFKRSGGHSHIFFHYNDNYFIDIWKNLKSGHFRIGVILATSIKYRIIQNLYFNIQPEIEFLTKILNEDKYVRSNFILQGTIIMGGIQTGVSLKF